MTIRKDKDGVYHIFFYATELTGCGVDRSDARNMESLYLDTESDQEIFMIKHKREFCPSCLKAGEEFLLAKKIETFSMKDLDRLKEKIVEQKELKQRWKIVLAKIKPSEGLLSEHYFAYISEERERDYKVAFSNDPGRKRVPKSSVTDYCESEEQALEIIAALKQNREVYDKALEKITAALKSRYEKKARIILEKIMEQL